MTEASDSAERQLGTLKAVPLKRSLRNDAKKLGLADAVVEITDNAIDNFAKQEKLGRASEELLIDIDLNPGEITIRENSGAVTPVDLKAFVQIGATGERAGAPHIGVWGAGQKVALAALGSDVTISTRYWDPRDVYELEGVRTEKVVLRMDPAWWANEEDWDVPVYLPERDLPAGETLYEIRSLGRSVDDDDVEALRDHLAALYGDTLTGEAKVLTIRVNGGEVQGEPLLTEEALVGTFAFPPGMEPAWHEFPLEFTDHVREDGEIKRRDRRLRMRVLVGLTPRQEKSKAGVYMFGVPESESGARLGARLFARALQNEEVGYSDGPRSILRRGDPTIGRLRIYVVFHGASEDIPWGLPGSAVKSDYYGANPFAAEIKEKIKEAARPFVRFTPTAREIDVVPYSREWNEMSELQRKTLLRRGAMLKDPEDMDEPDVAPRIRNLLRGTFKHPEIHKPWDHSKLSEGPPETIPAFDEALSKQLAKEIKERDRRLRELNGMDPGSAVETLLNTFESIKTRKEEGWSQDETDGAQPGPDRSVPVSIRIPRSLLTRLREVTGTKNKSEAVLIAIRSYLGVEDAS
jgi:hypothetical protein